MNDMRDLSTMKHGEPVKIYTHGFFIASGIFKGCHGRLGILVHTDQKDTWTIGVDSKHLHVEDQHGRLLGWVMEDPPLTTIPPELE